MSLSQPGWALILGRAVKAPLWLLITACLAHILGPEGLGEWALAISAAMLLNQFFFGWTQTVSIRFGREEWSKSDNMNSVISIRLILFSVMALLVFALIYFQPFSWLVSVFGIESEGYPLLFLALTYLFIVAETNALQQVQSSFFRMAYTPLAVDGVFLVLLIFAIVSPFGAWLSGSDLMMSLLLSLVVFWVVALGIEIRELRISLELQAVTIARIKRLVMFGLPLIPASMIAYVAEWIDYFLLRYLIGVEAVGIFHAAFQYYLVIIGLPTALGALFLPKLIDAIDQDDDESVREVFLHRLLQFTLAWCFCLFPAIALLPMILARLLGDDFIESSSLLALLLVAVPGAIVQHICMNIALAQKRLAHCTLLYFSLKCFLNIIVSIFFIERLGVLGAALGTTVAYIALHWLLLLDQCKRLKVSLFNQISYALLLSQVSGITLFLIDSFVFRMVFVIVFCLLLLWIVRSRAIVSRREIEDLFFFSPVLKRVLSAVFVKSHG